MPFRLKDGLFASAIALTLCFAPACRASPLPQTIMTFHDLCNLPLEVLLEIRAIPDSCNPERYGRGATCENTHGLLRQSNDPHSTGRCFSQPSVPHRASPARIISVNSHWKTCLRSAFPAFPAKTSPPRKPPPALPSSTNTNCGIMATVTLPRPFPPSPASTPAVTEATPTWAFAVSTALGITAPDCCY